MKPSPPRAEANNGNAAGSGVAATVCVTEMPEITGPWTLSRFCVVTKVSSAPSSSAAAVKEKDISWTVGIEAVLKEWLPSETV